MSPDDNRFYREAVDPAAERERLRAAVKEVEGDDDSYRAHLDLACGYLLGSGLVGCVAAIRRSMKENGLEPASLIERLVEE